MSENVRPDGSPTRSVEFVSPLPPEKTGIATYSASIIEGLDRIGFTERHDLRTMWPLPSDADERIERAGAAVFHIGNNVEFHGGIYSLAVRRPGVVVLHDLALDGLMWGLGARHNPLAASARAEALAAAASPSWNEDVWDEPLRVPWCAQVARRARAVIVHGEFNRTYLQSFGCRTPVFVAPHPLVERDEDIAAARARRDEVRAPFHSSGDEVLVCVAGDLNATKGIEETLQALALLDLPIHVLFLGRLSPHWDFERVLRESGQAERVTVKPDVPDDEFLEWLCASDIVVNLRHPHRGEASGSLIRAFQAGLPAIVSGVGTYLDWPDDGVMKVRPGPPDPRELARKLALLATDPDLRAAYGRRAREHVLETSLPEHTARVYENAIGHALGEGDAPVRNAVARWGRALAECGVTVEALEQGFGRRFADALDELLAADAPTGVSR